MSNEWTPPCLCLFCPDLVNPRSTVSPFPRQELRDTAAPTWGQGAGTLCLAGHHHFLSQNAPCPPVRPCFHSPGGSQDWTSQQGLWPKLPVGGRQCQVQLPRPHPANQVQSLPDQEGVE